MTTKDRAVVTSFFVLIVLGVVSSWVWIAGWSAIKTNSGRIDAIEDLYRRSDDRWTRTDMEQWIKELGRLNPGLKLP